MKKTMILLAIVLLSMGLQAQVIEDYVSSMGSGFCTITATGEMEYDFGNRYNGSGIIWSRNMGYYNYRDNNNIYRDVEGSGPRPGALPNHIGPAMDVVFSLGFIGFTLESTDTLYVLLFDQSNPELSNHNSINNNLCLQALINQVPIRVDSNELESIDLGFSIAYQGRTYRQYNNAFRKGETWTAFRLWGNNLQFFWRSMLGVNSLHNARYPFYDWVPVANFPPADLRNNEMKNIGDDNFYWRISISDHSTYSGENDDESDRATLRINSDDVFDGIYNHLAEYFSIDINSIQLVNSITLVR